MSIYKSSLALIAALWLVGCDKPVASADNQPATADVATYKLEDYAWSLQKVVDEQGQALPQIPTELLNSNKGITLHFKDQRILLDGLCNHISNSYELRDGKLQVGQGISTMKACPESALMMAEQYLAGQLPKLTQHQFTHTPPALIFNFDDKTQWQLRGEVTLEAKYGKPETVFYEIKAARPSCPANTPAATSCLNARQVFYNEQGIKTREGEWMVFTDPIEGYQHREDIHTILRLHRYTIDQQAKDQKVRYVLDMPVMVSNARSEPEK